MRIFKTNTDFQGTLTLLGTDVLTATTGYTRTHLSTSGQSSVHWGNLTSTPTTLAGYGIGATDVTAQALTGYTLGTNAALTTTDTILAAFGKVQAQLNAKQASGSYLTANQTITASGDATGSGTTALTLTLATVATPGTYRSVTVDAKGRVTAGTTPTTLAGYGITDAAPLTHTHAGVYQPADADLTAIATLGTIGGVATFLKKTGVNTWALDSNTYLTSPMTDAGDLIYGGASGVGTKLAIGTTGQVMRVVAGLPSWATLTASDVGAAATSHTHEASALTSGTIATAQLGAGTASATTWLRGDSTWATPTAAQVGAPTTTGTGASGSWPISVTGRATYLNTTYVSDMNSIVPAGVYQAYSPANQPTPAHWHWLQMPYLENSEGWAAQIAVSFYADALWFRRQSVATWQPWCQVLHSANYSSYVVPKTGGTFSGPVHFTGIVSVASGSIGVNTGIAVNGDITACRVTTGTTGTTGCLYLGSTGNKYLFFNGTDYYLEGAPLRVNNVYYPSDERLKTAIAPLTNALATLVAIPARKWRWRTDTADDPYRYGPIAQEAEAVDPGLVVEGRPGPNEQLIPGERPLLSIDQGRLVGLLHGAIHELAARLAALEESL